MNPDQADASTGIKVLFFLIGESQFFVRIVRLALWKRS